MRFLHLFIILFFASCQSQRKLTSHPNFDKICNSSYELIKVKQSKKIWILFPGFGQDAKQVQKEFEIVEEAKKNKVSILFMNFNQHLFLEENEKEALSMLILNAIKRHEMKGIPVYFGGYSSGGNVALLLANHLIRTKHVIQPKGVFIVDSPIDLLQLYKVSSRNLARNSNSSSVQESNFVLNYFNKKLGIPSENLERYEHYAPFTNSTKHIKNISGLKDIKLRFYAEPDYKWWKENRQNEPEDLNATGIENLFLELKKQNFKHVEYVKTKNKGYRSNGDRNPHSWSIVDVDDLFRWMEGN